MFQNRYIYLLLHPEVNLSLLTLLYAGITLLLNFDYSIYLKYLVKMSKLKSKSAGNGNGSSETLCNEINNKELIKKISIHVPTHRKPINDNEFGYYLAGLIDGDGHFIKAFQLIIVFAKLDISLAYYIKEKIGYGTIKQVKNKNAVLLIISNKKGLERVINLINGKIKTQNKFNQIINNIIVKFPNIQFSLDNIDDFNNYWLAGFSDADASFQIKIISRITINKKEIRLNYEIDQKDNIILYKIQSFLGGNISYRKENNTWYYESTNFSSAKKVIKYFNSYPLLSSKYINYLKWRKSYILIQNKEHLTIDGINKIIKYKNSMNSYNKEIFDFK